MLTTSQKAEVIATLLKGRRPELANFVAAKSGYRPLRFQYEGADAGVIIQPSDTELRVRVYHPLENIGKRGRKVEVWEYRLYQPRNGRRWVSQLKKRLQPGMPLQRVTNVVRTLMQEAERESIRRGDPYPARFHEPWKRQLKGMDPAIPDVSWSEKLEDRRGKDVCIKYRKPNVLIYSLKTSRNAARELGHHYLTVSWPQAKRVANIAERLLAVKGIDTVMQVLDDHGIRYKVQRYAEEMYASKRRAT